MMGRSVTRLPVALNTALAIAAGTPTITNSPSPLTPIGSAMLSSAGKNVGPVGDVGVDRDQVIGHVRVDDSAVAVVEFGPFQQGHPNASDHAADRLTVRDLDNHPAPS